MSNLTVSAVIYEDIKKVIGKAIRPIANPLVKGQQRLAVLKGFADEFVTHPTNVTSLEDYFRWHEEERDWRMGNGLLTAATFGELLRLWTNPDLFVAYEARLIRFIKRGGQMRRVFLLDSSLADPKRMFALIRALKRHEALGFSPRVRSILDLRSEAKKLGVQCDMFGSLNGRNAYFFQFPQDGRAIMLRSIEPRIVRQTVDCLSAFWKGAETAKSWLSRQPSLPPKERKQLAIDIRAVEEVARMPLSD